VGSALLAFSALGGAGALHACDPITLAAGAAGGAGAASDDPATLDRARLEAKIAELRAEIDALERALALPRPSTPVDPMGGGGLRVRRLGEPGASGSGGIVLLDRSKERAPAAESSPELFRGQVFEEVESDGGERIAAIAIEGAPSKRQVYRLRDTEAPRAATPTPTTPAARSCCCCCCGGGGGGAGASSVAPAALEPMRWRVAEPRQPGAPVRLRQLAPAAGSSNAAPSRGVLRRTALLGVPGAPGETRVIIERSPGASSPSCPAPCSGGAKPPPPAAAPEPFDPFGALPPTGAAGTSAESAAPIEIRTVRFAPAALPGAPGGEVPARRTQRIVPAGAASGATNGGAEYF